MTALHLTHVTKRLKIGCGFNIGADVASLRLAEDYATADVLSGGRITFGGRPRLHTREVETFGSPLTDQAATVNCSRSRSTSLQGVQRGILLHRGKHYTRPPEVPYRGYTLKELTLVPRPVRLRSNAGSRSGRQLAGARVHAKPASGHGGGGSAEAAPMHKVVMSWQEAHAKLGKQIELGERLCFGFHFSWPTASRRACARRRSIRGEHEDVRELRLVRALTEEQIVIMRDRKKAADGELPRIEEAVANGGFLCGSPAEIIDHLKGAGAALSALDRVSVSLSSACRSSGVEQLQRFGEEVMPAFTRTPVAAK